MSILPKRLQPWGEFIGIVLLVLIVALSLYMFKLLFWVLAPFLLAWLLSVLIRPMVRWLDRHLPRNRYLNVLLSLLLGLVTTIGVVFLAGLWAVVKIREIALYMPYYVSQFRIQLQQSIFEGRQWVEEISPALPVILERGLTDLSGLAVQAAERSAQYLLELSLKLPQLLIILVIALLTAYFYSVEYEQIRHWVAGLIPMPWRNSVRQAFRDTGAALRRLIWAQSILFGVSFLQAAAGFWLMGVGSWLGMALVILVVDMLPIVGSGMVLLPWSVWSLLNGQLGIGIALITLYVLIIVVRNILTPKLYAESFGIDPLTTIISMYIGLQLIGFWGLILAPLFLMIGLVFYHEIRARFRGGLEE